MLNSNDKQFIRDLAKDIFSDFEENGYLKIDELKEYISTTINLERRRSSQIKINELINSTLDRVINNESYQEFLNGKVKMCIHCKKIKPLSSYYSHPGTIDKKRTECKSCKNINQNKWQENNREKMREYNHKYKSNNKEKVKEQKVKWRNKNRDKIREQQKRWSEEIGEKVLEIKRKSYLKRYISKKINRDLSQEEADILFEQQKASGLTPSEFYIKVWGCDDGRKEDRIINAIC